MNAVLGVSTLSLYTGPRVLTALRSAEIDLLRNLVQLHPDAVTSSTIKQLSPLQTKTFLSKFPPARLRLANEAFTMAESMEGVVTAEQSSLGGQDKIITGTLSLYYFATFSDRVICVVLTPSFQKSYPTSTFLSVQLTSSTLVLPFELSERSHQFGKRLKKLH